MFIRRIPLIIIALLLLVMPFYFAAVGVSAESAGLTIIDDFEDGNSSDWTFFSGNNAGGGGNIESDRPFEGSFYLSTGWGGEGTASGFYGGGFVNFDNAAQITPPADPYLSVWVYNQSDATADQYTLEITIREDLDGNGWTPGQEDSLRLDTVFLSTNFNDQWVRVSASLDDFINLGTGGDGVFNGNLDELVIVIGGVEGGSGATVEVDFDQFAFSAGNPVTNPQVAFSSNQYSVNEGGTATVSATLSAVSAETVTVTYATSDGSAMAGDDYTATTGELVFAPGSQLETFTVDTFDNAANDDDRTVILTLSDPANADLGIPNAATLTIVDDEQDTPSSKGLLVENYESGELVMGQDADGNAVGYEFFSGGASTVDIMLTDTPPAPVPGSAMTNTVLQEDLFVTSGSFAGFSYKFTNETADEWVPVDWSDYAGIGFWLYGNNTGGVIFIDVQDNRNPDSMSDDAERFSIDIDDNFTGWQYFEFLWDEFNRKDVGNGAPNDGFGLTEIHGYAFGGFGAQPIDNSYYIDDVRLVTRVEIVDDFESGQLPSGMDANGIPVGYFSVAGGGGTIDISITDTPPAPVPDSPAGNSVLDQNMTVPPGAFAVYINAFSNDTYDEWVPRDWSIYEGVCFWLYGNNTGGTLFVDVIDNRNPGSTSDDAERYSVEFSDDFDGWQFFQFKWNDFTRKDIGNGAPNDGFTLTEVHGYAVGGFGSVDMGTNNYYLDNFAVWGDSGADTPITAEYELGDYEVTEGETATVNVTLNMTSTEPVTVTVASAESRAIPDRDFIPVAGEVVIPAGQLTASFTVDTIDEAKDDGDKNVMLVLHSAENAELGFRRQAVLNILDDEPTDPQLVDDFEGFHPFQTMGDVTLTVNEIILGTIEAGGAYEQVVDVTYDTSGGPASFAQTFVQPRDWTNYTALQFLFNGTNSGETYTVKLHDNQSATTADTPANEWVMVWSDEFDDPAGTPPNPNNWTHELGDGSLNDIPGWGNSESEYYTNDPANASTDGAGNLVITLDELPEDTDLVCYYGPCEYTSARLISWYKAEFEYGRIESRVKLPPGEAGLWPAFWTLGTDIGEVGWPQTGEIDIMEYVSRIPNEIFGTIHGPGYSGGASFGNTHNFGEPAANEYHTYAIEWTPDNIDWYVDDIHYHNAVPTNVAPNEWVFNHPFFMLLNVAIGGNFGGDISDQLTFPQETLVDYVRVYQAPDSAERYEATFTDNVDGWQIVTIPFADFARSASQPPDAPNDGLNLNEVWGYGFDMPTSMTGDFTLDLVRLVEGPPTSVNLTAVDGSVIQPTTTVWLILLSSLIIIVGMWLTLKKPSN